VEDRLGGQELGKNAADSPNVCWGKEREAHV
jgi:hypothetical protein